MEDVLVWNTTVNVTKIMNIGAVITPTKGPEPVTHPSLTGDDNLTGKCHPVEYGPVQPPI
jgi:hypothetical protein